MTFAECADAYQKAHLSTFRNTKHRHNGARASSRPTPLSASSMSPRSTRQRSSSSSPRLGRKLPRPITPPRPGREGTRLGQGAWFPRWRKPARWRGHLQHLLKGAPQGRAPCRHAVRRAAGLYGDAPRQRFSRARALDFAIPTAGRSGEVRGATWARSMRSKRLWVIPASRMEAGREHTVPLSARSLEILELPRLGDLVFPGAREGRPLSDMAMTELLRGTNSNGYRVHGFRSSFRDWAGD